MHNLIEYSNEYSKTSASFFQYYIGEQALDDKVNTNNHNNTTESFEFETNIKCQTCIKGTKNFETLVPLKQLGNFCRTAKCH